MNAFPDLTGLPIEEALGRLYVEGRPAVLVRFARPDGIAAPGRLRVLYFRRAESGEQELVVAAANPHPKGDLTGFADEAPITPQRLPRHIAIIMDGNGRWAKLHNLPRTEGHHAGAEAVRRVVRACGRLQIPFLTLFAFSTENWKRSSEEVGALMNLLVEQVEQNADELIREGVRVRVIGDVEDLPDDVRASVGRICRQTEVNRNLNLVIALNYGGRAELVRACRRIAQRVETGDVRPDTIDEDLVASQLYTANLPNPDLLIRPSGEMRLSNFLLWQSAYAEFWSTPVHWPDFSEQELTAALAAYSTRERRFGGISPA